MKIKNILSSAVLIATLGGIVFTSCDDSELYNANAPEWITDSIAAVAARGSGATVELEGMMEDVYTIGNTDYSSGWWQAFSKYYVIPESSIWYAQFALNINSEASNTYKNFALLITNDVDRGGDGYTEYGAIRYDNQPSGNSEWGDYIDRNLVESTLTFETDTDNGVEKLGGNVTLSVDRTDGGLIVTITNGTVTKTYTQTSPLANLNSDPDNTNIRVFLVTEGSYIDFKQTNIEPIGGCTSATDKAPLSMVLNNVPSIISFSDSLNIDELMSNVTATVTYEEDVVATVDASSLLFTAVPDLTTIGDKVLVAVYATTFKGEATTPITATANFQIVAFKSIRADEVVFYTPSDKAAVTDVVLNNIKIYGVAADGTETLFSDELRSSVVIKAVSSIELTNGEGVTKASVEWNGFTTKAKITAKASTSINNVSLGINLGPDDNSAAWGVFHSPYTKVEPGTGVKFTFTNYAGSNNYNNFVVVLTNGLQEVDENFAQTNLDGYHEYAVVRSDNYGWGDEYATAVLESNHDWDNFISNLNGVEVTVEVYNNGISADVKCSWTGNDGNNYYQNYIGIGLTGELWAGFTVDGSHLVFE